MEINIEKEEDKEMLNPNVVSNRVSQNCQCNELEERSKKAEVRCVELEFELQRKNDHCEALEAKVKALEGEKFAVEDEMKVLRMSIEGLKRQIEVGNVKGRNINKIVDLTEDKEDVQLMIENKVLECDQKTIESEPKVWEDKYEKSESLTLHLGMVSGSYCHEENGMKQENNWISAEGNLHVDTNLDFWQNEKKVVDLGNVVSSGIPLSQEVGDMQSAGTPSSSNGIFQRSPILNSTVQPVKKVRKQLTFEPEEIPSKKKAQCTPNGAKSPSVNVIDIIDSDDEPSITLNPILHRKGNRTSSISTCFPAEKGNTSDYSCAQNNEEDLNLGEDPPFVANRKRKQSCNVVTSESESDDDDDNMPICKLKKMHIQKVSTGQVIPDLNTSLTATISENEKIADTVMTRRRLLPLRECVSKSQEDKMSSCRLHKAKHQQTILTNDDSGDDESKQDLSYSDDENMSDFIVDDSDVSNGEDMSNKLQDISTGVVVSNSSNSQDVPDHDMDSDSQYLSDGDMDFGKILSKIQRSKTHKMKWEFEADMLAAFGKDSEMCMKAVCALYRQQTSEEQMCRGTMCCNQRGFSKFDAHRGSTLGEFLTDGDPHGGLKKSVKELQEYDPQAVELCRSLATHYSKQLFEIFKNKEDPFFLD